MPAASSAVSYTHLAIAVGLHVVKQHAEPIILAVHSLFGGMLAAAKKKINDHYDQEKADYCHGEGGTLGCIDQGQGGPICFYIANGEDKTLRSLNTVSYTHLDVYKRQR